MITFKGKSGEFIDAQSSHFEVFWVYTRDPSKCELWAAKENSISTFHAFAVAMAITRLRKADLEHLLSPSVTLYPIKTCNIVQFAL